VELSFWVTGQSIGGILTGSGTDPNAGPLVVLLAAALLPTVVLARPAERSAIRTLRRRHLLATTATAVAVCAALLLAATYPTPPPAPPPALTTAQQETGMTPGLPLSQPVNLNTATPRILDLRLVAEPKLFDISGKKVRGYSYDGDYVGPTMHFVPGETVNLMLVNKLPTWTNLHFHGMHISPSGNADNPYISVPPGATFDYHFSIPLDQPLGTFWYHDHDMCMGTVELPAPNATLSTNSTPHCLDIESQIYDGLSGTIVVGDDRTLLPPDLQHVAVKTLVIKDMQITPSSNIVANSSTYSISSDNPTVRLVDGQLRPVLTMRPGETELWRFANEGADIFYNLFLPGYRFTVVGQDGYPVAAVTTMNTLNLPPGKRWDVLVTASRRSGTSWLSTLKINNGPQGDTYPGTRLMKVKVAGPPMNPRQMSTGAIPTAIPSLANAPIAQHRTVVLSENAAGTVMYVNGEQFNPNQSVFSTPAVLGTTEQWTVENISQEIHVFHIHTEHFQVMSINGVPHPYTGEQDIIDVPYETHGKPGVVVIRVHFTDFTGNVMFHCHIASHEVAGMMSFINVVDPPPGYNKSLISP